MKRADATLMACSVTKLKIMSSAASIPYWKLEFCVTHGFNLIRRTRAMFPFLGAFFQLFMKCFTVLP